MNRWTTLIEISRLDEPIIIIEKAEGCSDRSLYASMTSKAY